MIITCLSEFSASVGVCRLYQYAVKAQTSLALLSRFRGSRVTTAHAHQCCRFQSYTMELQWLYEDCAVANEIDNKIDKA